MLASLTELRTAAQAGDATAQRKLADGYAGILDSTNAFLWYQRAAELGDPQSQWQVARHFEFGVGQARVDLQAAMLWYGKAATQNFANAQADLGQLLEKGIGGPPDYIEAYKWYTVALSNHSAMARIHRQGLELKMKPDDRRDGLNRAEDFIRSRQRETASEARTGSDPAAAARSEPLSPPALTPEPGPLPKVARAPDDELPKGSPTEPTSKPTVAPVRPPDPPPLPPADPALVAGLRLRGIAAFGNRRVATINQRNLFEGEEGVVTVGGRGVKVRCVCITDASASVQVDGAGGTFEIGLSR